MASKTEGFPWDLAFSPDGNELLVTVESGNTGIILWNVETCKVLNTLPVIPDTFRRVLFMPDGQALAYQHDGPKHDVRDVRTEALVRRLSTTWAQATVYSTDGQLFATASQEGVLQVLRPDGEGFKPVAKLDGQPDVSSAQFSPDGKVLAFGNNHGQVGIWDFRQGQILYTLHTADDTPVGDHQVYIEAFSPDGRFLLTKGAEEILRIRDLSTGKTIRQADFTTLPKDGWFLQDGLQVGEILGAEQSQLVNLQTKKILHQVSHNQNMPYTRMAVSQDGKFVTVSDEDSFDVYRTGGTQPILHIAPLPGEFEDQEFRIASQRLAVLFALSDSVAGPNPQALLEVWDLGTGQMVFTCKKSFAGSMVYYEDSQQHLVGSIMVGRLPVYDAETGALRYRVDHGQADFLSSPALATTETHDRAVFLSGDFDGAIWVWDAQTGQILVIFGQSALRRPNSGLSTPVTALAVQPGGHLLVSGNSSCRLQFLDFQNGTLLGDQTAHNGSITSIVFRADGKQFVTSSEDQTLLLWVFRKLRHSL